MYYIELIALSSINKVSFDNLMLMFLLILRRSEDSYKKSNTFRLICRSVKAICF